MTAISNPSFYQVSEITLHYQSKVKASLRPKITSSEDAYRIFHLHWDKNKLELLEEFKILLLNRANKVLDDILIIFYRNKKGGLLAILVCKLS